MPEQDPIIKPERQGLWTAVTFTLALLGLAAALTGVFRVYELTYLTQAEFLLLNEKITTLQSHHPQPPGTAVK